MSDDLTMRAVMRIDYSEYMEGMQVVTDTAEAATKRKINFRIGLSEEDLNESEERIRVLKRLAAQPVPAPARPSTPRPSTANPEKVAKTTSAAVEQVEKSSQARQTAIAAEGEAKRASIQAQGAQRSANQEAQANTRLEAQERAHLQRLIQDKERAEQRLAMKPRLTMAQRGERNSSLGESLNNAGNTLAMGITAPVVAGAGLTLREGIKWQSDFAGVKKTVNGSPAQLRDLEMSLRDMAAGKNAIPIQAGELAKIAESAGELGISGTKHVADFTRSMSMLSTTTNLTSEQAANSLARIDNILGTNQESFDRYGSALVALGNNGASTETEITEMAQRLAGEAKQIGLSAPQVLAFGSALSSVGVEAESGGTSFSKTWKDIDGAVRAGGKSLNDVAQVAGMSSAQFKKAWQSDAAGATVAFVQGLGKISEAGGSAAGTLDSLGMKESRQQDSLLRLAGAGTLLSQSLKTGEGAWEQNTAMAVEAGKRYETTASQLQILQNRLREVAIKASEAVLPGFNKELKGFSEGIPENAQKVAAAYEALGPAGQKAALGALAVTLAAGPTAKMIGTVTTLVGTYQKLAGAAKVASTATAVAGAAEGAGALGAAGAGVAGAEVAGAGGVAALASNPVGWIILAAAIVAAIGLAIKFKSDYDDILARNQQLTQDAKAMGTAFEGALSLSQGTPAHKSIAKLQEQTEAAKGSAEKLKKALDDAQRTKAEVKKMGLAPGAEDAMLKRIDSIIASIESTKKIQLEIETKNSGSTPAPTPPGFKRTGRGGATLTPLTDEEVWGPRAKALGMALPDKPQYPHMGMGGSPEVRARVTSDYEKRLAAYRAELAKTIKEVQEAERQTADAEKAVSMASFAGRIASALKHGNNNLRGLKKLRDEYDANVKALGKSQSNNTSGAQLTAGEGASGEVGMSANDAHFYEKLDARIKQLEKNKPKAKAKVVTPPVVDKNATNQAESIADQARADEERAVSKQLSNVNHVGDQFEGQLSRISQLAEQGAQATGEQSKKTAEAKAHAETLREEWDGTSQAIKNSHVEMAGLEVQLTKLNGLSNTLRQNFDGIADGLGDADFEKFSAFVSKVEGSLDLAGQRTALISRANQIAGNVLPVIKGRQDDLETRRSALQLSARKGFDDPKNPNDGNIASVGGRASGGPAPAWLKAMEADTGKDFGRNCAEELTARLRASGFQIGAISAASKNAALRVGFNADGRLPSGTIVRYPPHSSGYERGHYMAVGSDGRTFTESNWAKKGSPNEDHISSGRRVIEWEKLQRDIAAGRAFAFAPRGSLAAAPVAPQRPVTAPQIAPKATTPIPKSAKSKAATTDGPYIPGYEQNGELLNRFRLPGSFGGSMAQYRARDGESTSYRQMMEAQLREVLKAADELKRQKDGTVRARFGKQWETVSPWEWRKEGGRLDASKTQFDAETGGINRMRDVRRDTAQRGANAARPGEYSSVLQSMNRGDFKGNTFSERQEVLAKTAGAIMAETTAANREFSKSERDKATVLAAGRPFLQGANSDLAAYARALAMAEERQSALERYKPLEESAKAANAKAAELEAAAKKAEKAGKTISALKANIGASSFREQAKSFTDQRDKSVASDVKAAGEIFDITAMDAAQRALASTLEQRKENIELLTYQNKLLVEGKLSQEAITEQVEHETTYRAELKKLVDATQYNSPEQLAELQRQAREAADQQRDESRAGKTGADLTENQANALDSQRQIALLRRKLELTQKYGSASPQLALESRMAEARAELEGEYAKHKDKQGNLSSVKKLEFDTKLAEREKLIRAQLAVETATAEKAAIEDAKIAAVQAQADVLKATANTAEKRLEIEKSVDAQIREIRGQAPMTPEEEKANNERDKWVKQGEVEDKSRRAADEVSAIFQNGIETGMHQGVLAGLESIGAEIQKSVLKKMIESLSNDFAGVPNDPNAVSGGDLLGAIFGRKRGQGGGQGASSEGDNSEGSDSTDNGADSSASNPNDVPDGAAGPPTKAQYDANPSKYNSAQSGFDTSWIDRIIATHSYRGGAASRTSSSGQGSDDGRATLNNVRQLTINGANIDAPNANINTNGKRGGMGGENGTKIDMAQAISMWSSR